MKVILVALCFVVSLFSGSVAAQRSRSHIVHIKANRFIPRVIEILPNDTVTWINKSKASHIITMDNYFTSPLIRKEEKFVYMIKKAGYHKYYCKRHKIFRKRADIWVIID